MATQQITIFDAVSNPEQENLSSEFTNGLGFYLTSNYQEQIKVEVFLQVQITNTDYRLVRLPNKNVSSTERITELPAAITELGLPMRLSIVPSQSVDLKAVLIQSDCSRCSLKDDVKQLTTNIDSYFDSVSARFTKIEATLARILQIVATDIVIPGSIAPRANGIFKASKPVENITFLYHQGFL